MSVMQTIVVICQTFYHAHFFFKIGSNTNEILLLRGPSGAYLLSLHLAHSSSCFSLSFHSIFLFDHHSCFSITSLQLLFSLSAPFSPDCILKTHTVIYTLIHTWLLCSKHYQSHLFGSVTGTHDWMTSKTNAYVSTLHVTTYDTDTPFCYVYKVYQNSSIYDSWLLISAISSFHQSLLSKVIISLEVATEVMTAACHELNRLSLGKKISML